ncbi:sugar transferase [Paenibacillus agricola]|uniref:Sugar transferase n=1 Tax=Paenibacillus agricola TaxID=2716264 RepID=A0ABX0J5R3_9BACL|nr:sugar transferase [Paenibacillus agricola]NHN29394.1 sugar transferase [Paenibacillus agricola]
MKKTYLFTKRSFDLVFSLLGLLALLPVFLVVIGWIKLDSRGPTFFKQQRIGKGQKPFTILKFRTMVVGAEKLGKQITVGQDARITKSGRLLRKYKIDELPQLINVLCGQMSFVGPRPEVPYYVNYYNEQQKEVLSIRPGITDWASIKYSDENALLSSAEHPEQLYIERIMPDKLNMNLLYLQNASLKKDVEIIVQTLHKIM